MSDKASSSVMRFSIYYPQEIHRTASAKLRVYAFKESAANAVIDHAEKTPSPVVTQNNTEDWYEENAPEITVSLRLGEFVNSNISKTTLFHRDWYYFEFLVRPQLSSIPQSRTGTITFEMDGVIVADLPFSIYVTDQIEPSSFISATCKPYEAIFCSYSHSDVFIEERIKSVCEALNSNYLRSLVALRKEKPWREMLPWIDKADVFQLFWSEAAAQSTYVENEWRHALQRARPNFIRAVYWADSRSPIPQALDSIPFIYRPHLWGEMQYMKMPIDHLNMSNERLLQWKRTGIQRVGEVIELLEKLSTGRSKHVGTLRITRDIDDMIERLEKIGAWPPKHLQ